MFPVGCVNSVSSANRRVDQAQIDSVSPGWAGAFDDHAADLILARAREPRNASGRRWTRGVFECSLALAV
jgi:hypothetical protein